MASSTTISTGSTAKRIRRTGWAGSPHTSPTASHGAASDGGYNPSMTATTSARLGFGTTHRLTAGLGHHVLREGRVTPLPRADRRGTQVVFECPESPKLPLHSCLCATGVEPNRPLRAHRLVEPERPLDGEFVGWQQPRHLAEQDPAPVVTALEEPTSDVWLEHDPRAEPAAVWPPSRGVQ